MRRSALIAVALWPVLAIGTATAQTAGPCATLADTAKRGECLAFAPDVVEASRRAENGAVERTPWTSGVTLVAGRDASHAKLTLAPGEGSKKWIASVTTPIQKGDPTTEIVALDGLAEDVELAGSRKSTSFSVDRLDDLDFIKRAERRDEICAVHGLAEGCTAADLEKALRAKGLCRRDVARAVRDFEMVVTSAGRLVPILVALPVRQWEIGATVGRSEREFFSSDGEEDEEDRASYSLGGSFGKVVGTTLVKADARWQRKFKPQQVAMLCAPVDGSPTIERCKDFPLGRAEQQDRLPLSLEVRRWNLVGAMRWATSPRVTYDAEQEVWAARLPLYLVPDADANLSGGLSVDWQENEDAVFSVFVSAPLSLF